MKHKPVGLDIIMALGKGKHDDTEPDPNDPNEANEPGEELPPDFEKAWEEYHNHPSAQSFWDAVESCVGNKEPKKGY